MNRLLPILVLVLLSAPAFAQFPGVGQPREAAPEQEEKKFHDSRDRVSVAVTPSRTRLAPGEDLIIAVTFTIDEKWKIYAGDQPLPDEYYKTQIVPAVKDTDRLEAHRGFLQWPEHTTIEFFGDELPVYEGMPTVYLPVIVSDDAEHGETTIIIRPVYQSCDDRLCLPPTPTPPDRGQEPSDRWLEYGYEVTIEIVDPDALTDADRELTDADLFADFDREIIENIRAGAVPERAADADRNSDEAVVRGDVNGPSFFGLTLTRGEGVLGMLVLAILSAIGGLILNLTPCVLPIIPIKVMTIIQHANSPVRNLVLGLWMAAGVVAFWVGIGLPVAFVTGVTDPSQLFGIWWVTFGIGAIIALMGLGIMGLFAIQLPQSVYAVNPKADTPWGSFVFGVMTGVLGLPCFGFVAGALLAGAAMLPPATIMVIFTSLGVGMALPYLVLSMKPSLLEKIPQTGPASELVKQVMGLLLIAAAAYFIGAGLVGLVAEHPYIARQLHWWAVALFVTIAGVWLIVRTFQITPKTSLRASFLAVGLVLSSVFTLYAFNVTENARENWQIQQAARAEAGAAAYVAGYWNEWTPEAFEHARADGHIVLLDFTAEWCINCKVLKATVLDREPVRSELANSDVVKFTVDLTARGAPGWDFLRDELGQTGIPLLAIYAPGSDEPWQSNAYTRQQVLSALDEARAAGEQEFARR